MIRRRAATAGIATKLGNHSFRATGITAYLKNGGTLEKAPATANHASIRTTQLYDRQRALTAREEAGNEGNESIDFGRRGRIGLYRWLQVGLRRPDQQFGADDD